METTIDLDVRRATKATAATPEGDDPSADPKTPDAPKEIQKDDIAEPTVQAMSPKVMAAVSTVVSQVGSRTIPRSAGLQMLVLVGLTPEKADELLGEVGKTEFTTLAPEQERAHQELQAKHDKINRSLRSYKTMLQGVLARNRQGVLVTGSPIGSKQAMPEGPPYTGEPTQAGIKLDGLDEIEEILKQMEHDGDLVNGMFTQLGSKE